MSIKLAEETDPALGPKAQRIAGLDLFGAEDKGAPMRAVDPLVQGGLNLGLRDAATIGELVVSSRRDGSDVGAAELLARYDALRRADVKGRTFAVDLLNRTLLSDFLPTQSARGLGLYLIDRIGPLRRAVLREGVAPAASQPRLMRGEAL